MLTQGIQSSKASETEKTARLYVLSKTFEMSSQALFAGNPPTKDMIELFQK